MEQKKIVTHSDIYNRKQKEDFPIEGIPYGAIQWKGTNVCMDLYCECGHHGHVDDDFFYYYECPKCHAKYAVGERIKLIPLTEEEVEYAIKGVGFKTSID